MSDDQHLHAEVARLRKRCHELQERHDRAYAELKRTTDEEIGRLSHNERAEGLMRAFHYERAERAEDQLGIVTQQRDYARFVADKKHELIEELRSALATQIKANHTLLRRNTTIREERDQKRDLIATLRDENEELRDQMAQSQGRLAALEDIVASTLQWLTQRELLEAHALTSEEQAEQISDLEWNLRTTLHCLGTIEYTSESGYRLIAALPVRARPEPSDG